MGFFDLPSPIFSWIDEQVGGILPPTLRLILWAVVAAALSMWLYKLLSPQKRLVELKARAVEARRAVNAYDGDFQGVWPLMRRMLALSLRQVALVLGPAVAASLPILFLLVWLSNAYGYTFPPQGAEVGVSAYPESFEARWESRGGDGDPRIVVRDGERLVEQITLTEPVPTVHKYRWWNALIANPAGYLAESAPVQRIDVALPSQEFIPFGPAWARSWELTFFVVLIASSLAIKILFRIE